MGVSAIVAAAINGLAMGSIYALIVLGMNLLIVVRGVFYHGYSHIIMMSMGICFVILTVTDGNLFVAVLIMIAFATVLTVATEPLFRPLAKRGADLETVVLGMGVGIILTEVMSQYINNGASFSFPAALSGGGKTFGGGLVSFSLANILTIVFMIIVVVVLMAFLYKTRLGRGLRAVAQNLRVSLTLGISFGKSGMLGFAVAGVLAGVTALLLAMSLGYAAPTLGDSFAVKSLILVLFAGMGNMKGGLIAATFMGVVEAVIKVCLPGRWTEAIFFGVIMIVILARPKGLFGSKV
jgi:branched-chain amino acid transport system permease protein